MPQEAQLHLFLSPHFDDAVLSCGGMMADLAAAGHTVVAYTVMAGRPLKKLPGSAILEDLHTRWETADDPVAERRREDIKAVRSLGAQARHGAIPDCVYRVGYTEGGSPHMLYPSEESLWGPIHPADPAALMLSSTPLPYPDVDVLYVPLGAGSHVDHRIVRNWGWRLAQENPALTVQFYEEYPYSVIPGAVKKAKKWFGVHNITPMMHTLSSAGLQAKVDAVAYYGSQISTFWEGMDHMRQSVADDARQVGGGQPAERSWRVTTV